MKPAIIAFGSNLGESLQIVESALVTLTSITEIELVSQSEWYGSRAIGPGTQPDYINGAVLINTSLSPQALLAHTQSIESHYGRVRSVKWEARTLDLDLLWFDNQTIAQPELTVPHPRISERNFVLLPLNDIAPDLVIQGQTVRDRANKIAKAGIWPLRCNTTKASKN